MLKRADRPHMITWDHMGNPGPEFIAATLLQGKPWTRLGFSGRKAYRAVLSFQEVCASVPSSARYLAARIESPFASLEDVRDTIIETIAQHSTTTRRLFFHGLQIALDMCLVCNIAE